MSVPLKGGNWGEAEKTVEKFSEVWYDDKLQIKGGLPRGKERQRCDRHCGGAEGTVP